MKISKKIPLQQFLPLSEAEIQGLLHSAQVNLGYFLAGSIPDKVIGFFN
jgi:hypothetical protein